MMMWQAFYKIVLGDSRKLSRNLREFSQPMIFFIVLLSLFGIGGGLNPANLKILSPAIIWIAFFITTLWTVESFLRQEQQLGLFEQYVLSRTPLWWLLLAKSSVIWLASTIPLLLLVPVVGMALQLAPQEWGLLMLSIAVGSPAVVLLAVMGTTLTIMLSRSGFLLFLILLPLYIPVLVLGESMVFQVNMEANWWTALALLGGISTLSISVIPHVTAAALKGALDD